MLLKSQMIRQDVIAKAGEKLNRQVQSWSRKTHDIFPVVGLRCVGFWPLSHVLHHDIVAHGHLATYEA
jgi:hypothetical protein